MLNKKALAATAAAPETDDEFNQTVLLLHGDGTNGAQNNTFLDSSTNAFSITRNGNTTQGTFSPFSQTGWGVYFDGSAGLSTPDNADFTLGSSDWTIECWVYQTASVTQGEILRQWDASPNKAWIFYINSSNQLGWYYSTNGTNETQTNYTGLTVTNNQWNHIAFVRNGSTITAYINGQSAGSTTSFSSTINNSAATVQTGAATQRLNGYCSNLRLVVGTAVYTGAFTPPTSPLTAITNTKLLICQSNRFIDNSASAKVISVETGSPSVQAFSPFAPTAAYSAATNGGSGYFDGSGDCLKLSGQSAFVFGTGDFTIECWFYLNTTYGILIDFRDSTSSTSVAPTIYIDSSIPYYYASGANRITGSALTQNTWHHIAVSRSGTSTKMFVDGSQVGSTYTDTLDYICGTTSPTIGKNGFNDTYLVDGYISNVRIIKGTAVYTSNFTPPTAPLTAITNTSLLCNFTNAGIIDSTGKNNLETVGDAQIDTTTKKFGTGSMEFDGTGDYFKLPNNPNTCNFGTGDFTVEAWAYFNNVSSGSKAIVGTGDYTAPNFMYELRIDTATPKWFYGNSGSQNFITSSTNVAANTWYHMAVVRSNGTTTMYLNGTSVGSASDSSNYTTTDSTYVGAANFGSIADYMNGYIDDLRITKGVARYTANFTAPTKAFADQ